MRHLTARRLIVSTALAAVLTLPLAACKTTSTDDVTGSLRTPAAPTTDAEWRQSLDVWGARYRANPSDANAAIAYARGLRATGQRAPAVAVLEQASMRNPQNTQLLGEYGRALADAGEYAQALEVLTRAHSPDNPDWRVLNAQGAVLDQMGRHTEAQRHYSAALKIAPNEPDVLSNLGLSYALDHNLKQAETVLRLATVQPGASPKVRQNLALVVGLQGRFAEAERIASVELPPDQAQANINYLRQMLAQQDDWKKLGREPHVPRPNPGT